MQIRSLIPARTSRLLLIVTMTFVAFTAFAAPTWQGHEGQENGVVTVYNPAVPMNEPSVIKATPQWRVGAEDGEADVLFGLVTDARRTPDGRTYVLDAVLSTVYEMSTDGEVLRTLGKEGDGPGEFRNATSLALMPDLSIGIVEMMPSHMMVLGQDGLPQAGIDLNDGEGGRSHVQRLELVDDTIVMSMFSMRFADGGAEISNLLGVYDTQGNHKTNVMHVSEKQSGGSISISSGDDLDFTNNWTIGADGQIVVYQRTQEYLMEIFGLDGQPTKRIRRDYESIRREESDIEAQRQQQREMAERFGNNPDNEIQEMARDIGQVVSRPNGEIWVVSSQGQQSCPEGHLGVFDVFDAKGRFDRQMTIEADYDPSADNFVIRGDYLYVFKEAQNAPPRTMTGGGGNMQMTMISGSGSSEDDDDDGEEPLPFEVICYELPSKN